MNPKYIDVQIEEGTINTFNQGAEKEGGDQGKPVI